MPLSHDAFILDFIFIFLEKSMSVPQSNIERRFGGLNRLYGSGSIRHLQSAHIMVAGIGGVGSWCVEALARSAIGMLTIIDMDHVSESNINRQLPALGSTIGQSKIEAMKARIRDINPECQVHVIDDFVDEDNIDSLLLVKPDVLIDCTDQATAKIAMILRAKKLRIPLFVCGAAGGKSNPLALKRGDLSITTHDALLAKLRNQLRRRHGFAKPVISQKTGAKRIPKMGVEVFWLEEEAVMPQAWQRPEGGNTAAPQGLSCAGYGSSVTVTAPMGFAVAQAAIDSLLRARKRG